MSKGTFIFYDFNVIINYVLIQRMPIIKSCTRHPCTNNDNYQFETWPLL